MLLPESTSEIVLWAVGVVLLAIYFGARADGEMGRQQAISAFNQARTPIIYYPDDTTSNSGSRQDNSSTVVEPGESPLPLTLPGSVKADSVIEPTPLISSSDSLPIALLRIDRIGLEVPIFGDTSERNLNRGAGWVAGTAAPDEGGNMAIAAHRDGYFRVLEEVAVGDILELQSISSQQLYRVVTLSIVEPEDISPLYATDTSAVTLVTCYPFYFVGHAPQRYIVRAVAML